MGSGELEDTSHTYTEIFNEWFPYYLSIGMTYDQFWNQDVCLTVFYRKANRLSMERRNWEAWLQGAYVYEAVSTVHYNLNRGKKKAINYVAEPYDLFSEEDKEPNVEEEQMKARIWMINFVNLYGKGG